MAVLKSNLVALQIMMCVIKNLALRMKKAKAKMKREDGVKKEDAETRGVHIRCGIVLGVKTDRQYDPTPGEAMDVDREASPEEEVNMANAVDLSESESEEELEDIIDDFAQAQAQGEEVCHSNVSASRRLLNHEIGHGHSTRTTILFPVPRAFPCLPIPECTNKCRHQRQS